MPAATSVPITFATIDVTLPAPNPVPATQIPKNPAGFALAGFASLPFSNTRTLTILNTGATPLLFGAVYYPSQAFWPTLWGGTGANPIPNEGGNCTRIPVGGSLSIDIGSFQERGNMGFGATNQFNTAAPTLPPASEFPITAFWFSAVGGAGSGTITYINKLGLF